MEKFGGSIEIGSAGNEEREAKAAQYFDSLFEGRVDSSEYIKSVEREKTPEEVEIINLANLYSNAIRAKYGMDDLNIPPEIVHIVPKNKWLWETVGLYSPGEQVVELVEPPSKMELFHVLLHEFIHFKSYNRIDLAELSLEDVNPHTGEFVEDKPKVGVQKIGLDTFSGEDKRSFLSISEAVVEEATKRNIWRAFAHPVFSEEVEAMRAEKGHENYGESLNPGEEPAYIFSGSKAPSLLTKVLNKAKGAEDKEERYARYFSYPLERQLLYILCKKMAHRVPGMYKDQNAAYEEFEKAMMLGAQAWNSYLKESIGEAFGAGAWERLGTLEKIEEKLEWAQAL